eukprot:SAG31_NODE_3788_length_3881_cov_1.735590_3_plen_240_part_00
MLFARPSTLFCAASLPNLICGCDGVGIERRNSLFAVWSAGIGKSWKWSADIGGHYWRTATDIYNVWDRPTEGSAPFWQGSGSVLHNFDMAYSIPGIDQYTKPGQYTFLDQMVVGVVPGHGISGPGLTFSEAQAHMTMWVMAASPLLTCNDVRSMPEDIKGILTNPEVLAVHKDPLSRMATRIDVGGGVEEGHSGLTESCSSNYSVYGKLLADGSSAGEECYFLSFLWDFSLFHDREMRD